MIIILRFENKDKKLTNEYYYEFLTEKFLLRLGFYTTFPSFAAGKIK